MAYSLKLKNHYQQLALLQNMFPNANRIEWWSETREWSISNICGRTENIDYYTYIPTTKKFHFNFSVSIEV